MDTQFGTRVFAATIKSQRKLREAITAHILFA
jgi:hypothetical protein